MLNKINQIEQKINNGKKLIANAITDKGVTTPVDSTLETMANNINSITGGGGLEPGSMIPSSMLEPPQETDVLNISTANTKVYTLELDNHIYFANGALATLYRFDKNTKLVERYKILETEHFHYFKKFGERIIWISTTGKKVYITDLQFNILFSINTTDVESLNKLSSTEINACEIDDYYVILGGSYSTNYEYITTIHKETFNINYKKINAISSLVTKAYHYGLIAYNNVIYILGQHDFLCVDSNLDFINFSDQVKSSSTKISQHTFMYVHAGYIYTNEYKYISSGKANNIRKVNPETLEFENVVYEQAESYDRIIHVDNNYVYICNTYGFRIYDKNYNFITGLKSSTGLTLDNVHWINTIDNRIILQNNTNILMYDIQDNFKLIFDLTYSPNAFAGYDNFNCVPDFNTSQKIAYIFDDKIYMFRNIVSYIYIEPKYTIKAQALAELPVVMSYIAKRLKNQCTKEDCEDHK